MERDYSAKEVVEQSKDFEDGTYVKQTPFEIMNGIGEMLFNAGKDEVY